MDRHRFSRNDPCSCGSGKKLKHCCRKKPAAANSPRVTSRLTDVGGKPRKRPEYPIGTVALYGPDDRTTIKIAAGVIKSADVRPIIRRWVATDVMTSPKVQHELEEFFKEHGVKSVARSDGNMGCPHEEGMDFPEGGNCPFCPFWAGKQGSNRRV